MHSISVSPHQDNLFCVSSYNVNGIRAAVKKGLVTWLTQAQPDILCIQETKAQSDQIPSEILDAGYHAHWLSAEKKGYSGVGILSKQAPLSIDEGIGLSWADNEGRVLGAEFPHLWVYSIYVPSGTSGDPRQGLKMEFLGAFQNFASRLKQKTKPVLLCGDFNIAHKEIDIHDPISNKKSSGFLPEERAWFDRFLELGYVDLYRAHHPDRRDAYSWWTYRAAAKERNKGWRIDYQLGSPELQNQVITATLERELNLSDHVPVTLAYAWSQS